LDNRFPSVTARTEFSRCRRIKRRLGPSIRRGTKRLKTNPTIACDYIKRLKNVSVGITLIKCDERGASCELARNAGLARAQARGVKLGRPKVRAKVEAAIRDSLAAGTGI
jgi:hypothetical protein